MKKRLSTVFLDNSKSVIFLLIMISIFGIYCYIEIPREKNPDIKVPILHVYTTLRGISIADCEKLLVKPMEKELKSIEGVEEMTSYALDGRAYVMLKFYPGFDTKKALEDIRTKIDLMRSKLPSEATFPIVSEINLSLFPILNIALMGDLPERTLIKIAKDLQTDIESLPDVLNAEISGLRNQVLEIIISPEIITSYNLQLSEVFNAISKNNQLIAAGTINNKTGNYTLKIPAVLDKTKDIAKIVIRSNENTVITIGDIATIRSTFEEAKGFTRINGKPSLVLEISKRTGKNVVHTIEQVKKLINKQKPLLPENLSIVYYQDHSKSILENLNELQNTVIFATLLVVLIMLIFLGVSNSLLISLAIPGSFLIGIIALYLLGHTLNMVVLFSLIMAVGMLVDDSIVVIEYAHRKIMAGMSAKESFAYAISDMFWPVTAATLTKIAVFFPLIFWPGTSGQFMSYIPISLIATLSGSWIMALLFIPALGSILSKYSTLNTKKKDSRFSILMDVYKSLLDKVLDCPIRFLLFTTTILIVSTVLYFKLVPGLEFFPNVEAENALINVNSKGNISVQERDNIAREIEKAIADIKGINSFYTRSGIFSSSNANDLIAKIQIEFENWRIRDNSRNILKKISNKLSNIKGVIINVDQERSGPRSSSQPLKINLSSRNGEDIEYSAQQIVTLIKSLPGFINVKDSISSPEIEWILDVNKDKAESLKVDISNIGKFIQLITNGLIIGKYTPIDTNDEVEIIARFPEKNRNLNTLDNLFITTNSGNLPVNNFITRKFQKKSNRIMHIDSMKTITISSDIDSEYLVNERISFLQNHLNKNSYPNTIITFKGEEKDKKEAQKFLINAFVSALLLMILILIIEFNSLYHTFIVISAIFLSTTGVFFGLFIIHHTLSVVMGGMAIIALSGIVVNNNILLIDSFQHDIKKFDSYKEAIINSATSRLKPILLTAGTAILGFLPMIFKVSIDFFNYEITYNSPSSQLWVELSTTISLGLLFSTLLTSFFTPALLILGKQGKLTKKTIIK